MKKILKGRSEKWYLKPSRAFVREVRVDFETEASWVFLNAIIKNPWVHLEYYF